MRDRAARLELVTWILALLVGAWLRVPTETWLTHWDEGAYVAGPQHLGPFARDEPLAVYAPPLLPYALEGARRVCGVDPGRAIAVVAAFGVAAIVAAGWLARSLRGRAAGMFAVWCMALSPLSIAYSRMALTDVPFTAFLLAALAALVLAERRRSVGFAVLGGVFAGCGMLTKYHGFLTMGGLGIAVLVCGLTWKRAASRELAARRVRLAVAAGLAFAPFFVAALWFVAHDMGFDAFRATRATWTVGLHPWTVRQAVTFFAETVWTFDLPVVAATAVGGALLLLRRRRATTVLATAAVLAAILIAYRNYTRLFVPAIGLTIVFAACAVPSLLKRVAPRRRRMALLAAIVVAIVPSRTSPFAAARFASDAYATMARRVETELAASDGVAVLVGQYALVPYLTRATATRVIAINEPEGRRRITSGECAWIVFDEDPSRRPEVEAAWRVLAPRAQLVFSLKNPLPPVIEFDRTRGKPLSDFDRELRLYRIAPNH
jgi:4-amino-4-deoxy-L-arabinose transferase-like glycosyltransferase